MRRHPCSRLTNLPTREGFIEGVHDKWTRILLKPLRIICEEFSYNQNALRWIWNGMLQHADGGAFFIACSPK
jgi:hypothetical protein